MNWELWYCKLYFILNFTYFYLQMRMHEEQSPLILQRHVCEICGKSFKVKSNLKEHIRSHSDARTFLCGFCGKALKNRQCLNRHLFTHGVKYTCQVCGKNFANPSSLNVHKRDRHGLNVWKHLLHFMNRKAGALYFSNLNSSFVALFSNWMI